MCQKMFQSLSENIHTLCDDGTDASISPLQVWIRNYLKIENTLNKTLTEQKNKQTSQCQIKMFQFSLKLTISSWQGLYI